MNDHDFVFFYGNLNYPIDLKFENSVNSIKEKNFKLLYEKDQLSTERKDLRILHGFNESEIKFQPSYFDMEDKKKTPSFSDRIFWLKNKNLELNQTSYDCLGGFENSSDYLPVVSTFQTKILLKNFQNYQTVKNDLVDEIISSKKEKKFFDDIIQKFPLLKMESFRYFIKHDILEFKKYQEDDWITANCFLFSDILLIKDTISDDNDEDSCIYCHLSLCEQCKIDEERNYFSIDFLDEFFYFKLSNSKNWVYSINNCIENEKKKLQEDDQSIGNNLKEILEEKKKINKQRKDEIQEMNELLEQYEEIFEDLLQQDDQVDYLFLDLLRNDSKFLLYYYPNPLDSMLSSIQEIEQLSTVKQKKTMKQSIKLILDYKIEKKSFKDIELGSPRNSPKSPGRKNWMGSFSPRFKDQSSPVTPRTRRTSVRDQIQNIEKIVSNTKKQIFKK
jgi:hypothetical protein